MKRRTRRWAAGLAFMAAGCGTTNLGQAGKAYVVTAPRTAFYHFSPLQNAGPDAELELGQRVTLVGREYAYARVRTADGKTGYALWNNLAMARPPAAATPNSQMTSRDRKRRPTPLEEPKFDLSDVPLPELPEGTKP